MKRIALLFISVLLISVANAQGSCDKPTFHFSGKIYPTMYQGSFRGFNTGLEAGYGNFALSVLGGKVFETDESAGFHRFELQPRAYTSVNGDGIFAAFSYMMYNNGENSAGGMLGFKFNLADIMSAEVFGGIQKNTTFESDWSDIEFRTRFGAGLVFGF